MNNRRRIKQFEQLPLFPPITDVPLLLTRIIHSHYLLLTINILLLTFWNPASVLKSIFDEFYVVFTTKFVLKLQLAHNVVLIFIQRYLDVNER